MPDKKVIIVGGGLAGLIASIDLTRSAVPCTVIEKKNYPFHRVCGEYISNETVPYLKSLDAYPEVISPSLINEFQLTSVSGHFANLSLDPGGFGISRYALDHFLYQKAKSLGVEFLTGQEAESISLEDEVFHVQVGDKALQADVVIGSFGKRSRLDSTLGRGFTQKRSPYMGVKYHIRLKDFPPHLIALHNFKNGYCGISPVEDGIVNLCYLSHSSNLKESGSISRMEETVLFQNPFLKRIFQDADFLFEKPETISEISFETKSPLHDHILMAGDAAGMITPLCGNGMAIAIHSAKIVSDRIRRFCHDSGYTRETLESDYSEAWNSVFSKRLWAGRQIQKLFGGVMASNLAVNLASHVKPVANFLIAATHGKPF